MTPEPTLALSRAELATVRGVLAAHLPAGFAASAFGSRARGGGSGGGKAKPWSDLDLVIEGPPAPARPCPPGRSL